MLTLKSIEFEDFGPYIGKTKLDFSLGYTSFVGPNGSGKTCLGMVLPWILGGGKAVSLTEADLCPLNTTLSPKGKAIFDSDGVPLEIHRSSGNAKFIFDGKMIANTKTGTAQEIERVFKVNAATMSSTNFVAQGEIGDLISKNSETRIRTVESIVGTENFKNLESVYRRLTKDHREKVSDYDPGEYHQAKALVDERTLETNRFRKKSQDLKKSIQNLGLEALNKALKDSSMKAQYFFSLESHKEKAEEQLENYLSTKSETKELLEKSRTSFDDLTRQVELLSVTGGGEEDKALIEELSVGVESLERRHNKFVVESAKHSNKIEELKGMYSLAYEPDAAFTDNLDELDKRSEGKSTSYFKYIGLVDGGKQDLRAVNADGENCARCGSALTESHRDHIKEELDRNTSNMTETKKQLDLVLNEAKKQRSLKEQWETFHQRVENNKKYTKEIEFLSKELNKAEGLRDTAKEQLLKLRDQSKEIQDRISARMNSVKTLGYLTKEVTLASNSIDAQTELLLATNGSIRKIEAVLKDCEESLDSRQEEYDQIIKDINELSERIEHAKSKHLSLQSEKRISDEWFTLAEKKLHVALQRQDSLSEGFSLYEVAKGELNELKQARAVLKAFRQSYQNQIRPAVERIVNQVYTAIGDGEYTRINISDDYGLTGVRNGYETPSKLFSGAQKDTLAFAFRIALSRLKQLISKSPFGLMILDEPNAAFDNKRIDNFITTLGRMKKLVPQIICITHNEKLKQADQCFTVEILDGKSRVY